VAFSYQPFACSTTLLLALQTQHPYIYKMYDICWLHSLINLDKTKTENTQRWNKHINYLYFNKKTWKHLFVARAGFIILRALGQARR
jgi:hypothetical protein